MMQEQVPADDASTMGKNFFLLVFLQGQKFLVFLFLVFLAAIVAAIVITAAASATAREFELLLLVII